MRFHDLEANPDLYDQFIELLAGGAARPAIAEALGINKATVSEWKKRPAVQQDLSKLIKERVNEVLRHTDSRIVEWLRAPNNKASIDQLLKVRHEFAGDQVNLNVSGDASKALQDLLQAVDEDPALAVALAGILPRSERV